MRVQAVLIQLSAINNSALAIWQLHLATSVTDRGLLTIQLARICMQYAVRDRGFAPVVGVEPPHVSGSDRNSLAPREQHRFEHTFGEFRRSHFLRGVNQGESLGVALTLRDAAVNHCFKIRFRERGRGAVVIYAARCRRLQMSRCLQSIVYYLRLNIPSTWITPFGKHTPRSWRANWSRTTRRRP